MATTVSDGGPAPDAYRRAQRGLTRLLVRDMRGLRRLIRAQRLRTSVPDWIAAVQAVVDRYASTSAALAAEWYEVQRAAAGAAGPFTVPVADPPPAEQSEATLRWASKDLWPRDPERATVAQQQPLDTRISLAERKAEQAMQRLVLNVGRDTVRRAVREDREALAYARAAALGACSFCKLMASRGAVYSSAGAAGRDADDAFEGDGAAKYHNACNCVVVPIFRGQQFELSPHAAEWDRLYQEYAAGHPGDQLRRFRRALAEHDSNPLPGSI